MAVVGNLCLSLHAYLMISVAMCIVAPSEQRHASPRQALTELAAFETINERIVKKESEVRKSSIEGQRSTAASHLLRAIAPNLMDDSEVKALIDQNVARALEERLKFFPGLPTVHALLQWNKSVAGPRMGPVKEPLKIRDGRRILSMHDMASGYNEMSDNDYLMLFRSWELVDIFTYFSHVPIAVPPLQWTMVAHQRKRPALGTLMFEGGSVGMADIANRREEVLDKLVNLVDHYGFDGWFFNMETGERWPHGDPEQFIGDLRRKLKKKVGKHAMVIAYPYRPDSKMFDQADGVFVNYNWDDRPEAMKKFVELAGDRATDVYMGMDAFGARRGNNEPDPFHVSLCAGNNLSIAVFAPGFTLEVEADKQYSHAAVDYDRRYWGSIGENFGREVPDSLRSGDKWPVDWHEFIVGEQLPTGEQTPPKFRFKDNVQVENIIPKSLQKSPADSAEPVERNGKVLLQVDDEGHL